MATCPNCSTELHDGSCQRCGWASDAESAVPGMASPGAEPLAGADIGDVTRQLKQSLSDVVPSGVKIGSPAQPGGRNINIGDEHIEVHVERAAEGEQITHCKRDGRPLLLRESFECPGCGRIVCSIHIYPDKGRCAVCYTIRCALCPEDIPAPEAFECWLCHRVMGRNHVDMKLPKLCGECGAKERGEFVEQLKKGDTRVVPGQDGVLRTPEEAGVIGVRRGRLVDSSGQQVARLKDTTFYARQWYQVTPKRLQQEQDGMLLFYPHMQLRTDAQGNKFWQGQLSTRRGNTYTITLVYPPSFPYIPPRAYVIEPKIKESRHVYADGHLCLFHKDDRAWEINTTAATMVSWIAQWLHCYEIWHDTGDWPGKEHDQVVITTNY